jgi:hypothetical protein
MFDNHDNRALGLANVTSTDPYDCQQQCQANAACVFFVYEKSNSTCMMKKESGAGKGDIKDGYVTGPNHCSLMCKIICYLKEMCGQIISTRLVKARLICRTIYFV